MEQNNNFGNNNAIQLSDQLLSERSQGIDKLHQGIQEISELFQDMSLLVSAQGEQLDNIESNISSVANDTQRANIQLLQAKKYQKIKRRRSFYCGLIIFILIIIVIIIIYI